MRLNEHRHSYKEVIFILLISLFLTAQLPYSKVSDSYNIPKLYLSCLLSGEYKTAFNYLNNNEEGFSKLTLKKYISIIEKTYELDKAYYEENGYNFIRRSLQNQSFEIISYKSIEDTEIFQVSYNFEDTLQNINQKELFSIITWNIVSTFYIKNKKIKHIIQDHKKATNHVRIQYI